MTDLLVKMCGFTRAEDALVAAREGSAMIGLIFVESSARFVDTGTAQKVADAVKGETTKVRIVGVFVDETAARINEIAETVGLDLVQLHGEETPESLEEIRRPLIRAVRVRDSETLLNPAGVFEWNLYDTWTRGSHGGSGKSFDWDLLEGLDRDGKRIMLSGGLTPENVAEAIRIVRPDGVDVASGIESAPGVKDHEKIRRFMEQVRDGEDAA